MRISVGNARAGIVIKNSFLSNTDNASKNATSTVIAPSTPYYTHSKMKPGFQIVTEAYSS